MGFLFSAWERRVRVGGMWPWGSLACSWGLMASVTHTSEVRQCPSRVGDVHMPSHITCSTLSWEGERECLRSVLSAPRIPGASVPEALTEEVIGTGATRV